MRSFWIGAVLASAIGIAGATDAAGQGLTVKDGQFTRDGTPYRGYGVNYYDAFLRTLRNGNDTSYAAGFGELGRLGIPFARVNFGGFFPQDLALYNDDRAEYFRRLDGVVAAAEASGVDLVPTLFWNRYAVSDLVGEPSGALGDADSLTRAFMRDYAEQIVGRYKSSPAILMWEFGNEYNLFQDLPNQDPNANIAPGRGTPTGRTDADKISSDDVRAAVAEFSGIVNRLDPGRATTTGHSVSRPSAFELRTTGDFARDTAAEFRQMTADDHAAVDAISVHAYWHSLLGNDPDNQKDSTRRFDPDFAAGYREMLAELNRVSREIGKPLFLGEFGVADAFDWDVPGMEPGTSTTQDRLRYTLDSLLEAEVPMAALWVYDFQNPTGHIAERGWNITTGNGRAYQLEMLRDANATLVPEPAAAAVAVPVGLALLRRTRR